VAYWKSYWKNLPLSRNSGQTERKRPDREGVLWKIVEKVGRELYSLHQLCLLQHNTLRFMIDKVRAGELHSCLLHSSDRPAFLVGGFDLWRSRVYFNYTITTDKSARYSLQNRACKFGLKISSRKIHLVTGVTNSLCYGKSHPGDIPAPYISFRKRQ